MELDSECQALKSALKEKNKDHLTNLILTKSKRDRYALREAYNNMYGDLIKDLDKALHGNFKKVVIDLFKNPYERDAFYLYKSMKGVGTNDEALVEVLCSRSNEEIKKIIEEYKRQFNDDLERKVSSDTSGNYKKFLISLLQCQRSENSVPNDEECKKLAEELYKAGEGKLGTDEETFNRIFAITSPPELFSINTFYSQLSKRSLSEAVDKEFSGNLKLALSTILESTISPQNYYAKRINKAVKGLGTNDKMLIRNLISREGIDMREIREAYKNLFGKDMVQDIKDDTSGDYQKILVTIASGN
jgi:annexin A7/11